MFAWRDGYIEFPRLQVACSRPGHVRIQLPRDMVSDVFSSKLTHGTWHVLVQLERGYPIGFSGSGFCPISRPAFGILKQNRTEIWDLKTGMQPWVKIWVGWRDWRTSLGTDGKHAWVGRYNTNNTSWNKELPSVKKTSFVTLVVRNNWWR